MRRHAFYYQYTIDELDLLNELGELVRVKVNLFTPSRKPVGRARASARDGRPRRVYDAPRTPWERLKELDERDRDAGGPGLILPRQTRGDRTDHRHDEPRRTRPAHPRRTGPARGPGRAAHRTARQTRQPRHGILEQDARPHRGRRTGRRRTPASRRGPGFRAHHR